MTDRRPSRVFRRQLAVDEQVSAALDLPGETAQVFYPHGEVQLDALVVLAPLVIDEALAGTASQGFAISGLRLPFGFLRRLDGNALGTFSW